MFYGPPFDEDGLATGGGTVHIGTSDAWLDVTLVPAGCAQQADETPFTPGAYGDLLTRSFDGAVEVLVGDTVVRVDTSYGDEAMAALVTSIEPFDLDAEIARLSEIAERMWNDPDSFLS